MKPFIMIVLMRSIFLSGLICIVVGFKSFKPGRTDLDADNLRGKVKTVIMYVNEVNDQSNSRKASSFKYKSKYNTQGNVTETYLYDTRADEKLSLSFVNSYDTQGRKISVSNASGEVISRSVYSYNAKHHLTESIYDRKQVEFYILYNNNGTRDSMISYSRSGTINESVIYQYDRMGNLILENRCKPESVSYHKMIYKYDNKHNKLLETTYIANVKYSWTAFRYDKKGNVVMETDSNVTYRGNNTAHYADPKNNSHTYVYGKFDKADNWLEKQEMTNGIIVRITKREIEYY